MPKKIQLGKRMVGDGEPVFIVAEVANTHEGNFETAIEMISKVVYAGVDAVKFQHHIPSEEMISSHPKFHTQGKRALSIQELAKLKTYAESLGLYFLCTPFSRKAADELEEIEVDAFKIGSGEMTDLPFIEHVAKKGKPMIISTGMSEWHEIDEVVDLARAIGTPFILMHCVSIYPPDYRHLNLGVIPVMKKWYGVPIGLSDHTPEIYSAIAAIPLGASMIEKHYTLNRWLVGTSDHRVSLEPHEFRLLVEAVRKIEQACGKEKKILDEEWLTLKWARHAVVSMKDIPAGSVVTADAVSTKRPLYDGIPANDLARVIGRIAARDIPGDTLIKWDMLT